MLNVTIFPTVYVAQDSFEIFKIIMFLKFEKMLCMEFSDEYYIEG